MKKRTLKYFVLEMSLTLAFLLLSSTAKAAILWKDSEPITTKSRFNYDRSHEALEVSDFWLKRKVGIGLTAAGVYGLMGGHIAVHFHPQWSVDLGFGGGSHFRSFGFRIKKLLLLSSPLNPYFAFGFQRWERTTTRPMNSDDILPGYIAKNFLNDSERSLGMIDEKLIHGSLGLQYTFTQGEFAGYGLFLEGIFIVSTDDFSSAPTASFGMTYFF